MTHQNHKPHWDMTHPNHKRPWDTTHPNHKHQCAHVNRLQCDMTHPCVRHDSPKSATVYPNHKHQLDTTHPDHEYQCAHANRQQCDTTHPCVRHDSPKLVILCTLTCVRVRAEALVRSCVWHDAYKRVTWPIHMCFDESCGVSDGYKSMRGGSLRLICMCDMAHLYVWHDLFKCLTRRNHVCVTWLLVCVIWLLVCVTRLIHVCDVTHLYVWHAAFICMTWLIHVRVTWLIYVSGMTPSYTCVCCFVFSNRYWGIVRFFWERAKGHARTVENRLYSAKETYNFMAPTNRSHPIHQLNMWTHFLALFPPSVTWLIHVCDMTHSRVWHDSFLCVTWTTRDRVCLLCVTWLIRVCPGDMTHLCLLQDSFMSVTWLIYMCDKTDSCVWQDSFIRVTWLIHTCDTTHSYVWLRSVLASVRTLFFSSLQSFEDVTTGGITVIRVRGDVYKVPTPPWIEKIYKPQNWEPNQRIEHATIWTGACY